MSNRRRLIPPPRLLRAGVQLGGKQLVRNVSTGRILPCCWGECEIDGDDRYKIEVPHEDPQWPGQTRIYIFCSISHRDLYGDNIPQVGAIIS